jgi:hypothetical protein
MPLNARRSFKYAAVIWILVLTGVVAWIAYLIIRQEHSWNDMDLNSDGRTSVGELLDSIDIGRRPVKVQGRACTEMFAYKDGMPVKTICR